MLPLLRTAVGVVQTTMFARFVDRRETMAGCPREYYILSANPAAELWCTAGPGRAWHRC